MGEKITIRSADGFEFSAYRAQPANAPKGGIMVIQEIFGVNQHIREVADGYAREGYVAIAPAIFDRIEKGIELGYTDTDMAQGIGYARDELDIPTTLQDLQACVNELTAYGKTGAVGYCFGGFLTYLSACELTQLVCASGYYGGGIVDVIDRKPQIPLILHFGDKDAHIPLSDVEKIKAAHPDVPVYIYQADHGFNCDHRASYDKAAAELAYTRTLAFFAKHLQ
ncbi:MAG: dienelactone hydrolase family protein [Alphaproteobacteria bacterium]|nr:dienelactone hydrolase family protein [Alphaproteobacteria bacterium]